MGHSALVGAAIGAAVGAVVGSRLCGAGEDCVAGAYALVAGGFGAALGAGVGVGALAGLRERWREVPAHGGRVTVAPLLRRGTGVVVAVRF